MNITIKVYRKSDFESWLFHGNESELSSNIISKARAFAQIHNPDLCACDILLSVAWFEGECIGYRGVFPQITYNVEGHKIKVGWLTTFYVSLEYRGQEISKKLIDPLQLYYINGLAASYSSDNAIRVYKKLKWDIVYYERYRYFLNFPLGKNIQKHSFFKRLVNASLSELNRCLFKCYSRPSYDLEYVSCLNDEMYAFVNTFASNDMVVKSKSYLNWVIAYGWGTESPCIDEINDAYYFNNFVSTYRQYSVIVRHMGNIVGFYVLRMVSGMLSVVYLYNTPNFSELVYYSIAKHLIVLKPYGFFTSCFLLSRYVKRLNIIKIKSDNPKISLSSTPDLFQSADNSIVQYGDGDIFF